VGGEFWEAPDRENRRLARCARGVCIPPCLS